MRRLLLTTLLLCGALTACSGSSDGDQSATCLLAAVRAYPAWPAANGPVLENLAECKPLSAAQRATLRDDMTAFVRTAAARSQKEG